MDDVPMGVLVIPGILLSSLGKPLEGILIDEPPTHDDNYNDNDNDHIIEEYSTHKISCQTTNSLNLMRALKFAAINLAWMAIVIIFIYFFVLTKVETISAFPTSSPTTHSHRIEEITAAISSITDISFPAQNVSLQFILNHDPMSLSANSPKLFQRFVLMLLYHSMDGENWMNNSGFGSGVDECAWHGVVCDKDGFIIRLKMGSNLIKGTIPREIGLLESLVVIELYHNQISGSLPSELGNLVNIEELDLGGNLLMGMFPSVMIHFTNIREFSLSYNSFSGPLPRNVWSSFSKIEKIDLSCNQFSGLLPENEGLENISRYLMNNNSFTGTISSTVGSLVEIDKLDLGANHLTGIIPTELAQLEFIRYLYLDQNDLKGTSPSGLCDRLNYYSLDCDEVSCECCHCCRDGEYCRKHCNGGRS